MERINDAAAHATSLICNNAPKGAWQRKCKHFEFISSKSNNIVVCCILCAGNEMFSTLAIKSANLLTTELLIIATIWAVHETQVAYNMKCAVCAQRGNIRWS